MRTAPKRDKARVLYLGLVQNVLGRREEEISLPKGASVRELLDLLVKKHGDRFKTCVLRSNGNLREVSQVLIDSVDINEKEGLSTKIGNRGEVWVMVAVYDGEGG